MTFVAAPLVVLAPFVRSQSNPSQAEGFAPLLAAVRAAQAGSARFGHPVWMCFAFPPTGVRTHGSSPGMNCWCCGEVLLRDKHPAPEAPARCTRVMTASCGVRLISVGRPGGGRLAPCEPSVGGGRALCHMISLKIKTQNPNQSTNNGF